MISSAPARRETKLAVMDYFKNSGLFELYGSTEAGWVTMLHPEEQLSKLGSVGRECVGSRPIRLLGRRRQRCGRRRAGRTLFL
jgi:fatty-acyl-CoA synthase